ncbi:hypothetical protein [Natrinema sp. 1APR25-10V2]|uniref:hypothetical protein n=1 Tax=Natrinema sp. 1APR25-10V2 TaxID=2951081 RepID=UPI002875884F|nr:hypothetical protein [Natrinema sp. 1APR25-10V2]MDS0476824.1 hypothetical protein [Natrinema sp. 1APR25-10V2]
MAWSEEYPEAAPSAEDLQATGRHLTPDVRKELNYVCDDCHDKLEEFIADAECATPVSALPTHVIASMIGFGAKQEIDSLEKAYDQNIDIKDLNDTQKELSYEYIGLKGLGNGSEEN